MGIGKIMMFLVGLGLIIFAITPTPDDVTIISPIAAGSLGVSLILGAFGGDKSGY